MRRPNQEDSGFTMIEVLMALIIFSMTAVVLGSAFVNVLNSYEIAKKSNGTDVDLNFARSQLLAISDLQTAQNGQEFDDTPAEKGGPNRHVKWTADIEPTDTTDLFTVTFTCTLSDTTAAEPTKIVETFMLLRPTWSDPTVRSTLRQNAANRIAGVQGKAPQ